MMPVQSQIPQSSDTSVVGVIDVMRSFEQILMNTSWVTRVTKDVQEGLITLTFHYSFLNTHKNPVLRVSGPQECFLVEAEEHKRTNHYVHRRLAEKPEYLPGQTQITGMRIYVFGQHQTVPPWAMHQPMTVACKETAKEARKAIRRKHAHPCPECLKHLPKASPSLLLPKQVCRIHGYVDSRPLIPRYEIDKIYAEFGIIRRE